MGNSNKKKREKKMCTSGIIQIFFNSQSVADASITRTYACEVIEQSLPEIWIVSFENDQVVWQP